MSTIQSPNAVSGFPLAGSILVTPDASLLNNASGISVTASNAARPFAARTYSAGSLSRVDSPHGLPNSTGPLLWSLSTLDAFASPTQSTAGRSGSQNRTARRPFRQVPRGQQSRSASVVPAVYRQRFYPAQWKKSAEDRLDRIALSAGQQLRWRGWDHSLPRLYVPSDLLTRTLVELLRWSIQAPKHGLSSPGLESCAEFAPVSAADPGDSSSVIELNVSWQSGLDPAVLIRLENPRLILPVTALAEINASLDRSSLSHKLLEQSPLAWAQELGNLSRMVKSLGGSLTARPGARGSQFQLSVPSDELRTLVRNWLDGVSSQPDPVRQVSLFVIGRRHDQSQPGMAAADERLQKLAGSEDFVYRTARRRWLWLTTFSELPRLLSSEVWQTQPVCHWRCSMGSQSPAEERLKARKRWTSVIVEAMERALGNRVPTLDSLTLQPPAIRPSKRRSVRVDRPNACGAHAPNSDLGLHRWRYPI